jgi:putative N6-adenine-specific DNA methylase
MTESVRFFVSCSPGLESILASEYKGLGLTRTKKESGHADLEKTITGEDVGGLEFDGDFEQVYLANLNLRTASRVVVRLGEFYAAAFSELRKKASKLEWDKFVKPGRAVYVRAVCHKSKLYHSDAVVERVVGAINDHFSTYKLHPEVTQSPQGQLILVRIVNDLCTISIDSSGELLYKRGYKEAVAKAPLRENLAAAMLIFSGWDQKNILIDPFCGSGTIPIEAATLANHQPPGIARSFQFMHWPFFDNPKWLTMLENSRKAIEPVESKIMGFDRDTGAIEMAKANAARAGQKNAIEFAAQAISLLEPVSSSGWIVTNPPYGVRIHENQDLRNLYARFGKILKSKFSGWKVSLLTNEDQLLGSLDIGKPDRSLQFSNGGIPVKLSSFTL